MSLGLVRGLLVFAFTVLPPCAIADRMDSYQIGGHGQANIKYPPWFKESFLDLRADLSEARSTGKRGVIIFFSQKNCSHCQAFIDTTLGDTATAIRVRQSYDVIALDIFSDLEVTDIDSSVRTVKDFAEAEKARLTPTLLFLDVNEGRVAKIIGLYPPEKFNRVLDYVESASYKHQTLSQYLQSDTALKGTSPSGVVFDYTLFDRPPHNLARTPSARIRPLLVVFEHPECSVCDRFHQRVLNDADVRRLMRSFDAVQLDASDDRTILTEPTGQRITAKQWADQLQLVYDLSVVFFDESGTEVHRLDAETGRDRMAGSMQYVLEQAYIRHEQFLRWRRENAQKKNTEG